MLAYYKVVLAEFGEIRIATTLEQAQPQLQGVNLILLDFYLEHSKEQIQDIVPRLRTVAPGLLCSGVQELMVPAIGASFGVAGYWNKCSDQGRRLPLVRSLLGASTGD